MEILLSILELRARQHDDILLKMQTMSTSRNLHVSKRSISRGIVRLAPIASSIAFDLSIRPYTLRKGDSLDSIARKRGEFQISKLPMQPVF